MSVEHEFKYVPVGDKPFVTIHKWIKTLSNDEQLEFANAVKRQLRSRQDSIDRGDLVIKDGVHNVYIWKDAETARQGKEQDPIWMAYHDRYLKENEFEFDILENGSAKKSVESNGVKIIYAVGCGVTYASRQGWPTMVTDSLIDQGVSAELHNNGNPAAGNTYIANKVMLDSFNIRLHPPALVMIMWSGLTNKEFVIDHTDTDVMESLKGYEFIRWTGNDTSYVFSGGRNGIWKKNEVTSAVFESMYKYSNERTMAQETLVNIINCQNYLKQNNIPYIMSSYVNYWTNDYSVGENDYGIGRFPDLQYLIDMIDFDCWVFANRKKDCIYELGKSIEGGLDDDFEPSLIAHTMWADLVLAHIEKNNYLKDQ
jgi:hypothetical protein